MSVLRRTMRQGETRVIIVDCGDNAALDTTIGVQDRKKLRAGESVSSATVTTKTKPTGATGPTLGSCTVITTNTECVDRIVGSGEGFTFTCAFLTTEVVGDYVLHLSISTDQSEVIKDDITIELLPC